jgi:hypothetical protein
MSQQLPPTPPPAGMPYQQVPPKKSKKTLIIVLSIIGAFLLLCGGCGVMTMMAADEVVKEVDKAIESAEATPEPAAVVAGIGKPARDGNFEFTVKGVKCGVGKVGDQYAGKTAQGQFCLVTVAVKNIKSEPQMLSDSEQKAFVGAASYAADTEAALYANGNSNSVFLNNINPGNTVTGKLVFDIPKGAKLTKLELHDSALSGGVQVNL